MNLHLANWQRREQPVLSAMTARQDWCRVELYFPSVVYARGRFHMWMHGSGTCTRSIDVVMGYAVSDDGFHWQLHGGNPILTRDDLPFGNMWQSSRVIYDPDTDRFRMWFVGAQGTRSPEGRRVWSRRDLGYAESDDGLTWRIHPEPLVPNVHAPFVLRDAPDAYRMWINTPPRADEDFSQAVRHVFRFTSADGLCWTRDATPAVTAEDVAGASVVYPFVMETDQGAVMWYGSHVAGGLFEIFSATSDDGLAWKHRRTEPAFAASRDPSRFDGRYTSTPCVLEAADRYLLYYNTRDLGNLYGAADGTVRADAMGIYRHIGVAVLPRTES
jgi:hypothetical protein